MYRLLLASVSVLGLVAPCYPAEGGTSPGRCKLYGYLNWSVRCQVVKNTITLDNSYFTNRKTIDICASFSNRGGLNESAVTVTYVDADGDETTPFSFFETVRIRGGADSLTWVGTSPRHNLGNL